MRIVLLHEAEIEFWKAVDHYERREPGLGVRFKDEVDLFLNRIRAAPLQPRLREKKYHRVNLSVFRHYVAYIVRDDVIWVIAICHGHQRPEFWLDRMSKG